MALHGNRSVLNKSPGRFLNAGVATLRSTFNKHGMMRNAFEQFDPLAAIPSGARPPLSWVMAKTSGGMSSFNSGNLSISATGSGALGQNMVGDATVSVSAAAIGGLIAGGVGIANISITSSGSIVATTGTTGSASITIGAIANPGAIGWLVGQSEMSITADLVSYAKGFMTGTTEESGLSNAGIANSVWAKVIEAGFSADQILRLLAAHAAGSATGLEGANPQFKGLDGTTTRIDGNYVSGTRTIDSLNGG